MIIENVNFLLLTAFSTFLDYYPAKYDIIGSIDTTGCWKLTLINCYALFYLEKIYGLQTSANLEILTVFWKLFTLLENYGANSQLKSSVEKPNFGIFSHFTGHGMLLSVENYRLRIVKV